MSAASTFSIREAKSLVKDLSRPNPLIYWADLLATTLTGHVTFQFLLRSGEIFSAEGASLWAIRAALFAVTACLYMRASMFIHELVHLPKEGFRGFRFAWNLLCGIPFLIPSFMYYPHVDHHRRKHYGTEHDGEYLELSHKHPLWIVGFVAVAAIVPFAAWVRFGLLTPLCWAFPKLRGWVEKHASSMIIDIFYLRGDFGKEATRTMKIQEVFCFLWCMVLILRAPVASGQLIDGFLIQAYCISVALIMINNVRTLGAHRWMGDGGQLTFEQQLLDSVNYPYRPWITELWGPVGTRYHALHHLFPSIPYHNLGIAHRRLAKGLPAGSLYHDTTRVSLTGAIRELWQRSWKSNFGDAAASDSLHNDQQSAA
ncbi:MAG TPA: fatty acid desaturase [Planctomycetaceae bacterium]|nr:fatty acid desaturase [Planctomycetaceae bacterium]